ncbi:MULTISPECIES: LacI family DNA-binding transcriptional regulator [unclassified Nocardiopsis]|uniref:LacI family DNA-binding transcriptional regulator n=1 Tax=unclassified Nocardiopsis TaxID=2649073 RepID=UPI00135C5658|nr:MULTISPECIES: LacI family DNA-binding transcriptional regulator [unclassified Nocardiopsis]
MTSIRPRPATITDIARQAGVSTATVSYVLNDAPAGARIPEATRARVRAVADELGYVPHASARSLRTGSSSMVLHVHLDVVQGQLASEFLYGLTHALRELGYTLMQYGAERNRGVKAARGWAGMRPAAVIAGYDRLTPAGIDLLGKSGIRVVAVGADPAEVKGTGLSTLRMDNRTVGEEAARHLVGRGYRDLAAVIPAEPPLRGMGEERLRGLREAAAAEGATVRTQDMDWSPESAGSVVRAWLAEGLPEGVFGYNDEFSGLLLGALHDAGVRVPEQVGLVGADDIMLCHMLRPKLTTVRLEAQDPGEVARRIVEVVTERAEVHLSPWRPVLVRRGT